MTTTTTARFLLRYAMAAARQSRFAAKATPSRIGRIATAKRFLGAPANQAASLIESNIADTHRYENLVEKSIKKLMTTTNHTQDEPISNEDLEVQLQYFQKVFEEAELCLSDLRDTLFEADDEQYLEECSCAQGALNNAFTAYIDLLEDMRKTTEEQLLIFSEERNNHACKLKRLRKELDQIIEVAKNRQSASA